MIGLQPTGLAFGRLNIQLLLGCKSSHTCEPHTTGESKACVIFLLGASALTSDCSHMLAT